MKPTLFDNSRRYFIRLPFRWTDTLNCWWPTNLGNDLYWVDTNTGCPSIHQSSFLASTKEIQYVKAVAAPKYIPADSRTFSTLAAHYHKCQQPHQTKRSSDTKQIAAEQRSGISLSSALLQGSCVDKHVTHHLPRSTRTIEKVKNTFWMDHSVVWLTLKGGFRSAFSTGWPKLPVLTPDEGN